MPTGSGRLIPMLSPRWFNVQFRKYLASKATSAELQEAAHNRWDAGREKDVSAATWDELSVGMPKLCARRVGLDLKPLPDILDAGPPKLNRSAWGQLGAISSVRRDN